jgi:hypothetical protein
MKYLLVFLALTVSFTANADTYVRGHIRSDGTYVEPHLRSAPNNSQYDNYSTKGNSNPYTGKDGTREVEPSYNYNQPKREYKNPYDLRN